MRNTVIWEFEFDTLRWFAPAKGLEDLAEDLGLQLRMFSQRGWFTERGHGQVRGAPYDVRRFQELAADAFGAKPHTEEHA